MLPWTYYTKYDLRSAVYPMHWMRLMSCCGITIERMGMLGVSVRKMKALSAKLEIVLLIGKGRQNVTCFAY